MANLTGGYNEALDFLDWSQWSFDSLISTSETLYEFETPSGNTVELIGSGYTYDDEGNPTGGTVQVIELRDAIGNEIASLVLGDASLAEMTGNSFANFWPTILAGDDIIVTFSHDDTVFGYDGNDYMDTAGGDDTVYGGDGDDTINGGSGDDTVFGGAGDDEIIFNTEQGDDTIHGGADEDTVIHNGLNSDWSDSIHIERIAALESGVGPGAFSFKKIDQDDGRTDPPMSFAAKSTLQSKSAFESLQSIDSMARGEQLKTASKTDELQLKTDDTKKGLSDKLANPAEMGGGGDFDVLLRAGSSINTDQPDEPERTEARLIDVETILVNGRDGNDNLFVDNLAGTDMENGHIIYDGGAGDDDLFATSTDTAITYQWRFEEGEGHPGGGQIDFGDSTQDTLHLIDESHEGVNINIGLTILDLAIEVDAGVSGGGLASDLTLDKVDFMDFDFGDGDDSLIVDEDLTSLYSETLDVNFGQGDAVLDTTQHSGRVDAIGGDGQNSFFAGAGNDLLVGGAWYDELFGGAGADEIFGGGNDDEIGGGEGDDTLSGGDGGDRFFFEQGSGTDTITDFEAGDGAFDRLDFLALGTTQDQLNIAQMGSDTHITTEFGDTVILQNVTATDLNAGDFLI